MYIGYIRVSTWKQLEGNGLEAQELVELNSSIVNVYI